MTELNKTNQDELMKKIDETNKKLERLESKLQQPSSTGSNIWVLVPVAAIIMWGLTKFFNRKRAQTGRVSASFCALIFLVGSVELGC